jgi:hypothetical protein
MNFDSFYDDLKKFDENNLQIMRDELKDFKKYK